MEPSSIGYNNLLFRIQKKKKTSIFGMGKTKFSLLAIDSKAALKEILITYIFFQT